MRTFAVGDIHGRASSLSWLLQVAEFDKKRDRLISLGDVVDRGGSSPEVIDILRSLRNVSLIQGNHELWFKEWYQTGNVEEAWMQSGGSPTLESYRISGVPKEHRDFIDSAVPYLIEEGIAYVHGGFDRTKGLEASALATWERGRGTIDGERYIADDRQLWKFAMLMPISGYDHIFIGHNTVQHATGDWRSPPLPLTFNNLTMLDTGAGYDGGRLTMMDIKTRKYWQVPARD